MADITLKLENSKILKALIETLSSIIDETELTITGEEFIIRAMDPSRICLLEFVMKWTDFDLFEKAEDSEETIKLGINLDDFNKILKRASSSDSITLSYTKKEMKIKAIMQREGSSRKRTFSLALLDLEMEAVPMENLQNIEYPTFFHIDIALFQEALKDAVIYSEILNIETNDSILKFRSSGVIGEMNYELSKDDLLDGDLETEMLGQYSITFLNAIMKISSITNSFKIECKTDFPLKMVFTLLEGGSMEYYLAPRVEENAKKDDGWEGDEF